MNAPLVAVTVPHGPNVRDALRVVPVGLNWAVRSVWRSVRSRTPVPWVPAVSVPVQWTAEGLPIGSHFLGRFGDEVTLLQLAAQLEDAQPWRQHYLDRDAVVAAADKTLTDQVERG